MPTMLRQALLIGLAIAAIDWALGSVGRLSPDSTLQATAEIIDLLLNVALFGLGGYLGFKESGIRRGGAEVGVMASVIVGLAALVHLWLAPLPGAPPLDSLQVVQVLALNIALGGLMGLAGASIGRSITPPT